MTDENEETPLLNGSGNGNGNGNHNGGVHADDSKAPKKASIFFRPTTRMLLVSFFVSMSFSWTQVP